MESTAGQPSATFQISQQKQFRVSQSGQSKAKSLKSHTTWAWIARGWTNFNELDIDIPKYIIWYIYSMYIYIYMIIYVYINLWMLNPHFWMQIHWVRPMCASCTPVKPPHTCKRMTSLTKSNILDLDIMETFQMTCVLHSHPIPN